MSRCLIISQAYKRPIGLPVAAVMLIDGGQVGPQRCPQTYSVYSYRLPSAHFTYHRVQLAKFTVIMGGKKMLIRPHSPEEIQKHIFKTQLSKLLLGNQVSGVAGKISFMFTNCTASRTVSHLATAPIHYSLPGSLEQT